MIKINKVNNSLTVEGVDNVFYPNNGQNSYPLNSLIVVIDDSNMATFRSVATNDVLFSGLIEDITINGEAVTKDNIIQKFDAVSNSSTGGISDEQAQEIAKIPTLETEIAQKANASDVPTVQSGTKGTATNYVYSDNNDTVHRVISTIHIVGRDRDYMELKYNYWGDTTPGYYDHITAATTSKAGVMSAADKTKLDSMSTEWTGTQSEYDALTTKEDNKIYYVTE